MNAVTKISNLKYAYSEQTQFTYPDFEINSGEQLLILGKSGVGKSTLLHLLGLLLQPASGEIWIEGQNISNLSAKEAGKFRAKHLGIVFQQHHFIRSISVQNNLLAANYFAGFNENKERVQLLAESLKISHLLNKKTYQLSGGELQRAGIARSLMNSPSLVLADEPTANLDDENCHKVFNLLSETCMSNKAALIIVTHDQRLKEIVSNQLILQDVSS